MDSEDQRGMSLCRRLDQTCQGLLAVTLTDTTFILPHVQIGSKPSDRPSQLAPEEGRPHARRGTCTVCEKQPWVHDRA